jgi:coproporphyrinogen III oxidase-like Fe-S oxidoreductase
MNYDQILKFIVEKSPGKWWRNYPPTIYRKPVSLRTVGGYLQKVFSANNTEDIGLYIHIPFCPSRCYFCAFYSEPAHDKKTMVEYVNCLERELLSYRVNFRQHSLKSIYISGGTPTILDDQGWKKIFKIVNKILKIDKEAQISTEGTPETCTYSKLKLLKDLGVNRFSIGAQTFDEKILNALNRRHSVLDIYTAFENARKVNFKYLNVDLLFGTPGETEESFLKTLRHTAELRPDCISPAFLWFNKNVFFSKKDAKNAYVTKDQSDAKALLRISMFLKPFGYRNIINGVYYGCFLLNGQIQAHNQNIIPKGSSGSTFALGCASMSYLNYFADRSYQLQSSPRANLQEYISNFKKGKNLTFSGIELPEDEIIRQYLIYCFIFLQGRIDKNDFLSRFKRELMPILKTDFNRLLTDNKFTETQKDVYFHQREPYSFTNREALLLFCLKYLYSPKILNSIEQHIDKEMA